MTDPSTPTDLTSSVKTVRTPFNGVLISLPEEGVVSGGTAVHLSPRLESFLEHGWSRLPIPDLTEDNWEAIKASLIDELMKDFGLNQNWAEVFAESRLFWNRP